jgi:hypothetical protein
LLLNCSLFFVFALPTPCSNPQRGQVSLEIIKRLYIGAGVKEVIIGHCERGCNNTRFVESGIGVITWLARQLIQSFKTDGLTGEAY